MKRKLLLPFFNDPPVCTQCNQLTTSNLDHSMVCIKGKGRAHRHNRITKYLGELSEKDGIKYQIEKRNMIPNSKKKPADILLYAFKNGKDIAIDVGIAYVLKQSVLTSNKYKKLASANKYYLEKLSEFNRFSIRNKDQNHTLNNFEYIPFIIEGFGGIHPKAMEILSDFASLIAARTGKDKTILLSQIMNKLSAILQTSNSFMILNHYKLNY